jgi:hypothetical protein
MHKRRGGLERSVAGRLGGLHAAWCGIGSRIGKRNGQFFLPRLSASFVSKAAGSIRITDP